MNYGESKTTYKLMEMIRNSFKTVKSNYKHINVHVFGDQKINFNRQ